MGECDRAQIEESSHHLAAIALAKITHLPLEWMLIVEIAIHFRRVAISSATLPHLVYP